MSAHPATAIARQLAARAEAVCRRYLPAGRRAGGYWIVGDVRGTPGRSLYVRLAGPRAGKWTDAATGAHGDLLDLIAMGRGLDLHAALAEARQCLALPQPAPRPMRRCPTGNIAPARRLFAATIPIAGTLAETYLRRRGIVPPAGCRSLRFHPRCRYRDGPDSRTLPALIAAVTDLDGVLTGVQRTYLAPDGTAKAPVETPRRALGRLMGNGVRLGPPAGAVLAVGEGIETMLSLAMLLPRMPMLAALSATHLAAVVLPAGVRRLYVARDTDDAGLFAFGSLAERSAASGIDVRVLVPEAEDFNADLLELGPKRLRDRIAAQLAPEDASQCSGSP